MIPATSKKQTAVASQVAGLIPIKEKYPKRLLRASAMVA
jgi:hypothetical protein